MVEILYFLGSLHVFVGPLLEQHGNLISHFCCAVLPHMDDHGEAVGLFDGPADFLLLTLRLCTCAVSFTWVASH